MTSLDADLVRRKLAAITRKLDQLGTVAGMPLDRYVADPFRVKGTEKLLQETVEAAVDANLHLLRAVGTPAPTDYYESFVALGRQSIIPQVLAERLAPAAGLRNRLVHEYEDINDAIVLAAVGEARASFSEYVVAVERFLEEQGS
ncbi:MAG: DUF86 domain-containing protein [Gemmatimonadales bacterium]